MTATRLCDLAGCGEPVTNPRARYHTLTCAGLARRKVRPTKDCQCGAPFERPGRASDAQWEAQRWCSVACSNRYGPPRGRAKGTGSAATAASTPTRVVDHSVSRRVQPSVAPPKPVWRPAGFTPTPNVRRAS